MVENDANYMHQAVLLSTSVELLITNKSGIFIDGTYGRGGHSQEILNRLNSDAKLLVFDQDSEAITNAKDKQRQDSRISVFHQNFRYLHKELAALNMLGKVNGLLLDVGVSSPQLDDPKRGFSFQHKGPLDMRMNHQQGLTALDWLKTTRVEQIQKAFKEFADVRGAGRWARLIKERVCTGDVIYTCDLASLIEKRTPKKVQMQMKVHPATRIFQAIRIAVNDEISALNEGLESAKEALCIGGRLVVISFHSVEHRLLRKFSRGEEHDLPANFPLIVHKDWDIIRMLEYPNEKEVVQNRRARSARLTVLEKRG